MFSCNTCLYKDGSVEFVGLVASPHLVNRDTLEGTDDKSHGIARTQSTREAPGSTGYNGSNTERSTPGLCVHLHLGL